MDGIGLFFSAVFRGKGLRVETLLAQWSGGPYIFNLGHGVMPDTPIAHIARVVERVTGKPVKAMVEA